MNATNAVEAVNLAVVMGECSSPAQVRTLPSGETLVQLQVTSRGGGATTTVPVVLANPPAWVTELDAGEAVVAVGKVRRRFFRAAGATASRVEVEADVVARARDVRRRRALRRRIDAALTAIDP